jgi:hypothetical protein
MMRVHLAEIIVPGVWLQPDASWDPTVVDEIQSWFTAMLREIDRCAVALSLFEACRPTTLSSREARDEAREGERTHENALLAAGVNLSHEEMRLRVAIDLCRADAKAGAMPRSYKNDLPFMYAEEFACHLDMVLKLLKKIAKAALSHSAALAPVILNLEGAIGGTKDLRDSHQHRDERVVGKEHGKAIAPQQNATPAILGTAMIIGMLQGNRLGYTAADGSYADVDVSEATLAIAQAAVQAAHDAFSWRGGRRYHPGR